VSQIREGVAARVKFQREWRGWSQADLAQRLGVTQTAISYWESGKRRVGVDDLAGLVAVFGCRWRDLLGDEPDGTPTGDDYAGWGAWTA
jgi:transcriptional regulator with XRE-family HTH domain